MAPMFELSFVAFIILSVKVVYFVCKYIIFDVSTMSWCFGLSFENLRNFKVSDRPRVMDPSVVSKGMPGLGHGWGVQKRGVLAGSSRGMVVCVMLQNSTLHMITVHASALGERARVHAVVGVDCCCLLGTVYESLSVTSVIIVSMQCHVMST